jgi:hypothetical protein
MAEMLLTPMAEPEASVRVLLPLVQTKEHIATRVTSRTGWSRLPLGG